MKLFVARNSFAQSRKMLSMNELIEQNSQVRLVRICAGEGKCTGMPLIKRDCSNERSASAAQAYINLNQRLRDISRRLDHLIGRPTAPPTSATTDSFQWPAPTFALEPPSFSSKLSNSAVAPSTLLSPPKLTVTLSGSNESTPLAGFSPPNSPLEPNASAGAARTQAETSDDGQNPKCVPRRTSLRLQRNPSAAADAVATTTGARAKASVLMEPSTVASRLARPFDAVPISLSPRPSFPDLSGSMASAPGANPASALGRHWGGSARRNDRRTLTLFSRVSSVELQVQSLARKMEMLLASMQRMETNMKSATVERGRDRERDRRMGEGNEERRGSSLVDGTTVDKECGAEDGAYGEENSEE